MERVTLSWNFVNWLTVILMAAAGYVVLGAVARMTRRRPEGMGG